MNISVHPFHTPAMAAVFSAENQLQRVLDFEAALARAQAALDLIPASAAAAITAACRAERFDAATLYAAARETGTLLIPLLAELRAQLPATAASYVHWGATSQDALDTALVLQMRAGLALLNADLLAIGGRCTQLADEHRQTLMAGRTLLQQALPISFGLKAAHWLNLITRQLAVLRTLREALPLQFGGAAGTLAALGTQGQAVAERLALELDLPLPALPWHAERDRIAQLASALTISAGSCAKIAGDLVLLAQSEVAEVSFGTGAGGSSAMPQKRNPTAAIQALAAARLTIGPTTTILAALPQEHERAGGGWQAEWAAIPALFGACGATLAFTRGALEDVQVDPKQMRANLDRSGGQIMAEALSSALAPHIGWHATQQLVATTCRQAITENLTLYDAARRDAQIAALLNEAELAAALDPARYLGQSERFIDMALADYAAL
jgi:3-carboxy-cis,cis-muconate cycloisomerase